MPAIYDRWAVAAAVTVELYKYVGWTKARRGVEPPNPVVGEHGAKSNFSRCYSRGGSVSTCSPVRLLPLVPYTAASVPYAAASDVPPVREELFAFRRHLRSREPPLHSSEP